MCVFPLIKTMISLIFPAMGTNQTAVSPISQAAFSRFPFEMLLTPFAPVLRTSDHNVRSKATLPALVLFNNRSAPLLALRSALVNLEFCPMSVIEMGSSFES